MITFVGSDFSDRNLLQMWIDADPWHSIKDVADWWIIGGYLHFKLEDEQGVVCFVRFDQEPNTCLVRLHTQFAPSNQVSEKRVAVAISDAIPRFVRYAKENGVTGIITESVSPKLVAFLCSKLNFKPDTGSNYLLSFNEV